MNFADSTTVVRAEPNRYGGSGSTGDARYMLIRQFQFPHKYSIEEHFTTQDSDRCYSFSHSRDCIKKHTGSGVLNLKGWVSGAADEKIMIFLKEILKADPCVNWTGYRVLLTVNRRNGHQIFTLQLFARDPGGDTEVFTGEKAPNVIGWETNTLMRSSARLSVHNDGPMA